MKLAYRERSRVGKREIWREKERVRNTREREIDREIWVKIERKS